MSRTVRKMFFARILPTVLFFAATAGVHASVPGVPYQIPSGFESYPAGTLITYGGINYVSQGNGTMLLAASQPQQYTAPQPTVPLNYIPPPNGGVIYYNNPPYTYYNNQPVDPYRIYNDVNRIQQDQWRIQNSQNNLARDINNGNWGGAINDFINLNNANQRLMQDQRRLNWDTNGGYNRYGW
ncbi:hypothetical protein GC170_19610 [bacterium]|nr:hypothetical protein [bacterium]